MIHGRQRDVSLNNIQMLFNLVKSLLLICIPLISSSALLVEDRAAGHAAQTDNLLALEFLKVKKHSNGQVSQSFTIHQPDRPEYPVTILFQENQDSQFYTIKPENNSFEIFADKASHIRLFIFYKSKSQTHIVHTNLMLFGKSRIPVKRISAALSDINLVKTLPHISLMSAQSYYWHQTGIPLKFTLNNVFYLPLPELMAMENEKIIPLKHDDTDPGAFTYIPPHGEYLKKNGSTATRQDTIFTSFMNKGTLYHLSYALQAHRSRHAHDNHLAGTVILFSGIVFFAGLIMYKRQTRPWWKE